MQSYGIHRVPVPPTWVNACAIVVLIAGFLMEWPGLRWVALASLGLGGLSALGLIVRRRGSTGVPRAARLNFPADER